MPKAGVRLAALLLLLGLHSPTSGESIPAIMTKDLPIYRQTVDLFEETMGIQVTRYDMKGDTLEGKAIAATLNKERPPLILAVGSSAAQIAEREINESIPVVFCMVADPEAAGLMGSHHSTGVTLSVPLNVQFGALKSVLPGAAVMAAIYDSAATTHVIEEAYFVAAEYGMKIKPVPIGSAEQIPEAFGNLPESVDLLWMLPDVLILRNAQTLITLAAERSLAIFAPSKKMVRMGALLALSPDYRETGRQAAELAKKLLLGVRVRDLPFESPSSLRLVINKQTVEDLNIEVPSSLLGISIEYE